MEELAMLLFFLAPFLWVLAIGGLIADYVFPHIGPLNRWIDTLPLMQNDVDG